MNPSNIAIQLADVQDLSLLMEVLRSCIALMESQGIHQWDEIYPTESNLGVDIKVKRLWIARIDGRIGGMVVLDEYQEPQYQKVSWRYDGRILVVHRLLVAPAFQNQKLATYLMRFAEDYASDKGYDAIRMDAFVQNPFAVRLYRRLGYFQAGTVTFRKGEFYCFEKRVDRANRGNNMRV